MNSTIRVILFLIFKFHILKSFEFPIVDFNCKTPDGKSGDCIEITKCQSIANYIKRSNNVFDEKLRQFLKEYTCGFNGPHVKVCCPQVSVVNNMDNNYQQQNNTSNNIKHKNVNLLPTTCGMNKNRNVAPYEIITPVNEITGSQEATLNEFPWMALLTYSIDNGSIHQCAGTIINERYILTAASCINNQLRSVRVGEHNIATTYDCEKDDFNIVKCSPPAEDIAIEKAFRHEEFKYSVFRHDIGLIRLSKSLNIYTANVKAICLPLENSMTALDSPNIPLMLTGWGITVNNLKSNVPLKTEAFTIPPDECTQPYKKRSYNLTLCDKQFCIGGQRNGKKSNICNADAGSPVQKLDNFRYTQYGIVSTGARVCRKVYIPVVSTKVGQYIDWILNNIEP